ncbi:spermidine synthase [Haloferula sp.]|uniref:spermine/spermidine synthase domain-containing protein n=1 Tax=Haloferula sp. TaxID=2497595 RepID=UPI003C790C89
MTPYILLDKTSLPDGTLLSLHKHGDEFILEYNGLELMSTGLTYSEQMLAELGCADLLEGAASRPPHPRVLIGGLGMGFTLKRVLELIGSPATVDVAELMSQVIEWNRSYLVEHNGPLLEDPRTNVILADLFDCLGEGDLYDAILIDIDDTPDALITEDNAKLYTPAFLALLKESLNPGGCLAYWMAVPSPRLEKVLKKAGFQLQQYPARPHQQSDEERHRIYVARLVSEDGIPPSSKVDESKG